MTDYEYTATCLDCGVTLGVHLSDSEGGPATLAADLHQQAFPAHAVTVVNRTMKQAAKARADEEARQAEKAQAAEAAFEAHRQRAAERTATTQEYRTS